MAFVSTRSTQVVDELVPAQGQAFKKGPAVAQAALFACADFGCQTLTDTEAIELVR